MGLARRGGATRRDRAARGRRGGRGLLEGRLLDLDLEDVLDGQLIDGAAHLLEQGEALALILELGVALAIAAQADPFAQAVHRVEVLLPGAIEASGQELALDSREGRQHPGVAVGKGVPLGGLCGPMGPELLEHRLLTRVIENAQGKVEGRNFDIRKHLLEYDDVMNKQRTALYGRRRDLLTREDDDLADEIQEMTEGVIVNLLGQHWPAKGDPEDEDIVELARSVEGIFGVRCDPAEAPFRENGRPASESDAVGHALLERMLAFRTEKSAHWDGLVERYPGMLPPFARFERDLLIRRLDRAWKEHLHTMDGLREGVSLRGYGQRDPKLEYQREGFALFEEMNASIDQLGVEEIFKVQVQESALEEAAAAQATPSGPIVSPAPAAPGQPARSGPSAVSPIVGAPAARAGKPTKIGRNAPCSCGSGKKFKKCCGA